MQVEVMELDEMWHWIKKKKISSGYGQLLGEKDKGLLILPTELVEQKQEKNYEKKSRI
ncbi:MAG: hypothetical protein LBG59_06940 [Candidatus Peribacteria bacterium]|jgi:hypothetical protein|nr:hypothetical protein [Candidatus Peribacteria bacterium]